MLKSVYSKSFLQLQKQTLNSLFTNKVIYGFKKFYSLTIIKCFDKSIENNQRAYIYIYIQKLVFSSLQTKICKQNSSKRKIFRFAVCINQILILISIWVSKTKDDRVYIPLYTINNSNLVTLEYMRLNCNYNCLLNAFDH